MTKGRWTAAFSAALALAVALAAAQAPDPQAKARVDAFLGALASGNAERYEAMAQENFSRELLARRSPADRRQMAERIRSDFGQLTLKSVTTQDGETFVLAISGSTGLEGAVEMTLETSAERRIAQLGVKVGGPPDNAADALPPPPINAAMSGPDLSRELDAYLAKLSDAGSFSGVVLVARDGTSVFEKAYGLADREKRVANTPATRFNLGSINKIFTKTAIGQLMAQGKVSLTDTVGKLLPDYPNAPARAATVDQLLTHRAGIADFFGPAFNDAPKSRFQSNADYYRFVAPQPLLFEPGTKRQYCNGCYIVLGAIVERVSGVRYEDYIADHVFKPAGMKGAGFFHSDKLPAEVAQGYTRRGPGGNGELRPNTAMHGVAGSGAGGAYASAADLLAFDNALREQRLLDPKTTAWVLEEDKPTTGRSAAGLGIAGGAPGVNAVLESEGRWTVVVVGNLDPPAAERLGVAIHRQLSR